MGKTALVTGGTGFVGSRLVRRLLGDDWNVHLITRPSSNLEAVGLSSPRLTAHHHDGTTETAIAAVRAARPDVVFHLAAYFRAQHAPSDVTPMLESNLLFGAQLLEAMAVAGVRSLVNTGTSWQHFKDRESDPVCLYAATKESFERLLAYYVETSGLKAVTLKLFDTYGPRDPRPKLFAMLKEAAERGLELEMSPGEQKLDLVFIDDVVAAYLAAAERLLAGKTAGAESFAVGTGRPRTLRDIVETFGRVTGRPVRAKWGAKPYRPREVMTPWTKGKPLPGWSAKTTLEEGIALSAG